MLNKQQFKTIIESLEVGAIFTDSLLTLTKRCHFNDLTLNPPELRILISVDSSLFIDDDNEIIKNTTEKVGNDNSFEYHYQLYVNMVNENISILKNKINATISRFVENGISKNHLDSVGFKIDIIDSLSDSTLSQINQYITNINTTRFDICDIIKSKLDSNTFTIKDFDSLNELETILCSELLYSNKQMLELLNNESKNSK